ncbi:FAD-binding oxidoreductase [Actinomadura sp. 3N508]|uniref:FAD-binding oxidoreductase n=1 Tax=Actinomadura sp. 3N508 TaxID=3375153 RepID=UPI00379A3B71
MRFDDGSRALYAGDASNFRQVPIGVVIPRTLDDVVAVHRICREFGVPILNRGGGTSLSGETVNHAVVIDHSKYLTEIGEVDPEVRTVTCETGVINEELNRSTGRWNLVFGGASVGALGRRWSERQAAVGISPLLTNARRRLSSRVVVGRVPAGRMSA